MMNATRAAQAAYKPILACLLAAVLLFACSPAPSPQPIDPTTLPSTQTQAASAEPAGAGTATPAAVIQPTPTDVLGRLLLVGGASEGVLSQVQAIASAAGWTVEQKDALSSADLVPGVRAVIALSVPADLQGLMAASPEARWVVVSPDELAPGGSLTVIRVKAENQAFAAGFITQVISTDWRGAGLLPDDSPLGARLPEVFANGGHYFCGVCAPGWPLNEYYPVVAPLPSASDGASWLAKAQEMLDSKKADVVYVTADAARPDVWNYLIGKDQLGVPVRIVSSEQPPAELRAQWAATVTFDIPQALKTAWAQIESGQGAVSVDAPVTVENVNSEHLTEGKMRLVIEVLAGLANGQISPFTVPNE